jgi:hypothetical protein
MMRLRNTARHYTKVFALGQITFPELAKNACKLRRLASNIRTCNEATYIFPNQYDFPCQEYDFGATRDSDTNPVRLLSIKCC